MGKSIRVTVTYVYEYIPDLGDLAYQAQLVTSVEDAMALDQRETQAGLFSIAEFIEEPPKVTALWEVIEDGT